MTLRLRDFTATPGGRYRADGEHSAEQWREEHLLPAARAALASGALLEVSLDGVAGVPVSFCEEAFGGLARAMGQERPWLFVECDEEPIHALDAMRFYATAGVRE